MLHASPPLRRLRYCLGTVTYSTVVPNGLQSLAATALSWPPTSASFPGTSSASSALRMSRAAVKYRSLSPNDPFGEQSSWEDPSDGLYAAWKDVDQEGFVVAAGSAEVRQAHFGPEWARFTTVGRLSVKKMKENQAEAATTAEGDSAALSRGPVYPAAEELHAAELKERRQLMEKNYMTYEAFAEQELCGGGEEVGWGEEEKSLELFSRRGAATVMGVAVMERRFSEVDGQDGKDRMAQRNTEREALELVEAAEDTDSLPLPQFILDGHTAAAGTVQQNGLEKDQCQRGSPRVTEEKAGYDQLFHQDGRQQRELEIMAPYPREGISIYPVTTAPSSRSTPEGDVPSWFVTETMTLLGHPHGDPRLPYADPIRWQPDDIICFLTVMEHCGKGGVAAGDTAMDESMCTTFQMASVTGETLLYVVTPPRLFRLMRRWHVRRQRAVNEAWKTFQAFHANDTGSHAQTQMELTNSSVLTVVQQQREKLNESVDALDRLLIQETILLCFPYAR